MPLTPLPSFFLFPSSSFFPGGPWVRFPPRLSPRNAPDFYSLLSFYSVFSFSLFLFYLPFFSLFTLLPSCLSSRNAPDFYSLLSFYSLPSSSSFLFFLLSFFLFFFFFLPPFPLLSSARRCRGVVAVTPVSRVVGV